MKSFFSSLLMKISPRVESREESIGTPTPGENAQAQKTFAHDDSDADSDIDDLYNFVKLNFTLCIGTGTQKSEARCESSYIAFSLYKCPGTWKTSDLSPSI